MVKRKHAASKRHGSDLNSKPNTMTPLFTNAGVFFLTKPGMYEEASGNTPQNLLKISHVTTRTYWRFQAAWHSEGLWEREQGPLCKGRAFLICLLHPCSSATSCRGDSWSWGPMPPWGLGLYSSAVTVTPGCSFSMKAAYVSHEMAESPNPCLVHLFYTNSLLFHSWIRATLCPLFVYKSSTQSEFPDSGQMVKNELGMSHHVKSWPCEYTDLY